MSNSERFFNKLEYERLQNIWFEHSFHIIIESCEHFETPPKKDVLYFLRDKRWEEERANEFFIFGSTCGVIPASLFCKTMSDVDFVISEIYDFYSELEIVIDLDQLKLQANNNLLRCQKDLQGQNGVKVLI